MKLRVGHLDYTIRAMTEADDLFCDAAAAIFTETQEIVIDADHLPDRQLELLLHELVHAMWDAWQLPPTVNEERAASSLGAAFAALIRSNPRLLTVLASARDGAAIVT